MMCFRRPTCSPRAAFSLVELSVVMVILSIIAVSGLEAAGTFLSHTAMQTTIVRLQTIDNALKSYRSIYGRLPCPADRTVVISDGVTNYGYGKEYCNAALVITGTSIWQGMVPVRDLNLPLQDAVDGWGDKLNYLVTSGLTDASTYVGTSEAIAVRNGLLQASCTTYCQDVGNAAYFVFSNGADRRGAITPRAAKYPCIPSPATSYDQRIDTQNCNYTCTAYSNCLSAIGVAIAANVFYDSRYNTGAEHGNGASTTTNGTTIEQNYFDDLTVWRPKGQL